jgi:hypothetical protein
MYRLLLILCVLLPLRAEILDRIAITVGRQVITELQLDEELRVTAFLNHQPMARNPEARRAAADRLIQQLLVRREMELSHYPLPEAAAIDKIFEQVRNAVPLATDFKAELRKYDLTESVLREHLTTQLMTLQFIELRFRPELGVSPTDIENYYQRQLLTWKAEHPGQRAPTLADSKELIRKTLAEQRTDEALDAWLEARRKQDSIVYLDRSLEK